MTIESIIQSTIEFVRLHEGWAVPIVFALAFGESLAFISLLIPATAALVGIGALVGMSGIAFVPIWIGAAIGAALGDWLSYWFGLRFKEDVAQMWPLSRYPDLLPRGERFVERFGVPGIFLGRFFGPLRATVPLAAGVFAMRFWAFQLANVTSAFAWAAVLLGPGTIAGKFL